MSSGNANATPGAASTGVAAVGTTRPAADPVPRRRPGRRTVLLVAAVVAVVAVPPLVSLLTLRTPRWYPIFDMAIIEISVRDVASARPPLVGLVGRLGTDLVPGHHPGPLGFYSLWPVHALAGGSAFALRLSAFVLTLITFGSSCWMASRRGGRSLVIGVGAVLALLVATYPAFLPVEPWNPYQPTFWWPVVLLGIWSVLDDDLVVLPLVVFAACLCAQTHISYLGLVGGMGALTGGVLAGRAVRRRSDRHELRRLVAWGGGSLALGFALWIPPLAQQLFGNNPNLSIIWHDFTDPSLAPIGLRRGTELMLIRMNPLELLRGRTETIIFGGHWLPGALLVLAWAATVPAAARLADRRIVRLDAVLGAALLLGVLSARSVHGLPYPYLFLWAWVLAAFMILAAAWTLREWGAAVRSRSGRPGDPAAFLGRAAPVVGLAALVAFSGVGTVRAPSMEPLGSRSAHALGGVVQPTIDALERGGRPGYGADGRYLVTWTDPMTVDGQGWGLVNELLRAGLDAAVPPSYARLLTGGRARRFSEATALVHLSVGPDIATWRACPGARMVAFHDPRTPAERAEARRLTTRAQARLREVGSGGLAPWVERAIPHIAFDPRLPADVRLALVRIVHLGFPLAVFTASPDVHCAAPASGR